MPPGTGQKQMQHSSEAQDPPPAAQGSNRQRSLQISSQRKKSQNNSGLKEEAVAKPAVGLRWMPPPTHSIPRNFNDRGHKMAMIETAKKLWDLSKRIKCNEKRTARVSG